MKIKQKRKSPAVNFPGAVFPKEYKYRALCVSLQVIKLELKFGKQRRSSVLLVFD
jgi:hypothetical protein